MRGSAHFSITRRKTLTKKKLWNLLFFPLKNCLFLWLILHSSLTHTCPDPHKHCMAQQGMFLIGVKISLRPWRKPIRVWEMSLCHLCPRCQRDMDCNTDELLRTNVPLSSIIQPLYISIHLGNALRYNSASPISLVWIKSFARTLWRTDSFFLRKPFSTWLGACIFVKKQWKGFLIAALREQQLTSRDCCDWILALNSECTKFSCRCRLIWIRRYT